MRARLFEVRLDAAEMARVEALVSAWRALHRGSRADALRALLRLGLDVAARPRAYDERWCEIEDRLARIEMLLDALGRAVAATPSLAAWLLAHAPSRSSDGPSPEALEGALEELFQLDWDERCRQRGVPRPRAVERPTVEALGGPSLVKVAEPRARFVATTVRLAPRDFERAMAHAQRVQLGRQAALAELVQRGLDAAETEAARDALGRLLAHARRIERQLDMIGPLATSPASVVVHLWRQLTGRSEEWERILLHEVRAVAEATWHGLQAGQPQPVPGSLALDPIDEREGDGWPT